MVRSVGADDVERVLDLIAPQEFVRPLTREDLDALFTYDWHGRKPNLGFLVSDVDAGIVGYEGIIYSPERTVDGRPCTFANLNTAYIDPHHRTRRTKGQVIRYSIELIRAAIELSKATGATLTSFTARGPNDVVPRLLVSLGFEEVSQGDVFCPLFSALGSLLRPGGRVLTNPDAITSRLTDAERRLVADHRSTGCTCYLVDGGDRYCLVIAKARRHPTQLLFPHVNAARLRRRRLPVSDILHMSDPQLARAAWGRLIATIALRERVVGVTCAQGFFPHDPPSGVLVPWKIHTFGRTVEPHRVDKLYSELVVLRQT